MRRQSCHSERPLSAPVVSNGIVERRISPASHVAAFGSPRFFVASLLRMTEIGHGSREASADDIAATPGFTKSLAEKVLEGL